MEHRSKRLRAEINALIDQCSPAEIRFFYHHCYGVAKICALLAMRRGVDPEIAYAAGLLHDIYQITARTTDDHAVKGAPVAEKLLRELGTYSDSEITQIVNAVARHSSKDEVQEPLDEIVKDADLLDHDLNAEDARVASRQAKRYYAALAELGCVL